MQSFANNLKPHPAVACFFQRVQRGHFALDSGSAYTQALWPCEIGPSLSCGCSIRGYAPLFLDLLASWIASFSSACWTGSYSHTIQSQFTGKLGGWLPSSAPTVHVTHTGSQRGAVVHAGVTVFWGSETSVLEAAAGRCSGQ